MEENSDNAFIRLIENYLVVELIAKKLNFRALKAVTLVSKDCLNCFRNTKSFSTRVRFTISEDAADDDDDDYYYEEVDISEPLHVFQRSTYDWKNVLIELGVLGLRLDHEIAETEHRLRSVKSILFYSSFYPRDANAKVLADWLHFEPMLERMENLEELKITGTCKMFKERPLTSGGLFQHIFPKLERLKIDFQFDVKKYFIWKYQANLQRSNFQPKKFCCLVPPVWCLEGGILRNDISLNVAKIVDAMKDTLEELQLHCDVFVEEAMETIRLPKLKRLLLSICDLSQLERVKTFLQNQVPLEELQLRMEKVPFDLLKHLQEAGKLGNLQKLCIQVGELSSRDSWTFLRGLRKLKVVHVAYSECVVKYCSCEKDTDDKDVKSFARNLKIMMTGLRELYSRIKFIECCQSSCDNCCLYER